MFRTVSLVLVGLVVGVAALALAIFGAPTLASHTSDDVPTGVFYHDDATTIKDLGITTGCSTIPPLYCPNNFVTRGEMASFLARAAKLSRATSATTVVNTTSSPTSGTLIAGVTAPAPGGLLIDYSFSCASFSGTTDTRWNIDVKVDSLTQGLGLALFFPHAANSIVGDSASMSVFVPVSAGNHNITYTATRTAGDGSLDCNINTSSLFVPFKNDGTTP